jgi:hypothetical protein
LQLSGWAHRRALSGICGGGPAAIGTKKARRATASAFSFRGKALDIRDIGRQRSPGGCLVNLNSRATMALFTLF